MRRAARGVIVAQGGREQGYAVHLLDDKLAFEPPNPLQGEVTELRVEAKLPGLPH